MTPRYAHDVGERVIPIGEAYALEQWYCHEGEQFITSRAIDGLERWHALDEPFFVVEWKPREELIARLACGLLLAGLLVAVALVGVSQ